MPQFKTTHNIFKDFNDEVWNDNNMDSDKIVLPPSPDWSYDRVMEVQDVEIWEVIIERGGGVACYAAWCPYAEFYMIRHNWGEDLELFYGRFVQPQVLERLDELNIQRSPDAHFRFMDKFNDKNLGHINKGSSIYKSGAIQNY